MIPKFKLKWKKNLIVFLQINLHINKTVISWKLMWEITRYIPVKDKTQLSKELYITWILHYRSLIRTSNAMFIFSKSTWNPISEKKDTVFYYTSEYNICMALHVLENSSENQNVALHDWKFTKLNRISF